VEFLIILVNGSIRLQLSLSCLSTQYLLVDALHPCCCVLFWPSLALRLWCHLRPPLLWNPDVVLDFSNLWWGEWMNHLLSSSLAIIFPWCSVWLTEVPSWESPGRSFSDSPLPSPWSLSSSSDSILYFFPIKGRGCLALRYWRFAFPYFGRYRRFTKYTTRRIRSWSTRWCWPKSGSVSTFLTSIWFPTGKIFPVSTLSLSFSGTESMGWPRWLRLTRQLIVLHLSFIPIWKLFKTFNLKFSNLSKPAVESNQLM